MIDTAELKRLMAAGTPGPWKACPGKRAVWVTASDCHVYSNVDRDNPPHHPDTIERWKSDAALIVAAVNALPGLVARVEELEARLAVLDEALTIACDERDEAFDEIESYNAAPELEAVLKQVGNTLNALWSAFDDSCHGGRDADGEEIVSIPHQSFAEASEAMDALDNIATVGTGWLGYRVKATLRAALKGGA